MYRIKNSQGLYWRGNGSYPRFDEHGKVWKRLNHARAAVSLSIYHERIPTFLEGCTIVRCELVEVETLSLRK